MTLKFRKRHKRWRKKPADNLLDCSACVRNDHQECEDNPRIFCACWRNQHEETF